jgi:dimethylhistidine N-methyltransferase
MQPTVRVINSREIADSFGDRESFALDVLVGLSESRKSIPSKYLYDSEGSRLFDEITSLPEYYLTESEKETLSRNLDSISRYISGQKFNLVEFGAGDGSKAGILIDGFIDRGLEFRYVPIDISHAAMSGLAESLHTKYPSLELSGLVSEYFTGIKYLNNNSQRRNLVLFLGSNIGNFSHAQARFFLRNLWNGLNDGDYLLIGFDLKKDIEMLLWAYNDRQGVTAKFNLNVLKRINRELGGQFDISKFRHFGTYDVFSGAMESYLVSLDEQRVPIDAIGRDFHFYPWEPIHTEYSYKYLVSDIDILARETGFVVKEHMTCPRGFFVDSIWQVTKSNGPNDSP